MRIQLDECIDEELRHYFIGHDCQTCRYAKLRGLTNGQLLDAAEAAGFEVLVTVDQNMQFQQRVTRRRISLLVLAARTTTLDDLAELVPEALLTLGILRPGHVVRVGGR